MLSLDLFGAPTARCGDGVVTLDFDADAYSCHYYPVEHGWEAGAEPLLPIWREPEVSDDRRAPHAFSCAHGALLSPHSFASRSGP